jgi:hypothetical protein
MPLKLSDCLKGQFGGISDFQVNGLYDRVSGLTCAYAEKANRIISNEAEAGFEIFIFIYFLIFFRRSR